MILSNAVARHNEPYDRLAEESVKRRLLIVGIVSGGTAEGHARTTCLVIGRSAHVEQGLQDDPSAPQTAPRFVATKAAQRGPRRSVPTDRTGKRKQHSFPLCGA